MLYPAQPCVATWEPVALRGIKLLFFLAYAFQSLPALTPWNLELVFSTHPIAESSLPPDLPVRRSRTQSVTKSEACLELRRKIEGMSKTFTPRHHTVHNVNFFPGLKLDSDLLPATTLCI
jgi:hypothetical protein